MTINEANENKAPSKAAHETQQVKLEDFWGRPLKAPTPSSPPQRHSVSCSQEPASQVDCPLPCLGSQDCSQPSPTSLGARRSAQQLTMRRYCNQTGRPSAALRTNKPTILPRRLEIQWSGRSQADSEGETEPSERDPPRLRLSSSRCVPSVVSTCHTLKRRGNTTRRLPDTDEYTTPVPIKRRATVTASEVLPSRSIEVNVAPRPLRWSTPLPGTVAVQPFERPTKPQPSLAPVRESIEPSDLPVRGITPVGEHPAVVNDLSEEPVNRKRHRALDDSSGSRKLVCKRSS
eukprot:Blabericola_migrator_1__7099@NODE_359_length_9439_cov_107_095070_g287_i0_p4_GENE_NODE_359_length_9439_cov_107_095070_g287_i0NODE_359_length_9439_cov_107_095070_g287_i0_p4_ORF_typecomplete_len289_score24_08_NODE_359_length_9439_cov_107_095070_g287_i09351801